MANQIARQFTREPNETAVTAVAAHLERFWEREMRIDLARAIDEGTVTVDAVVVQAVERLAVIV